MEYPIQMTKQHLSTKIFKAYFIYLREHFPKINIAECCEKAGLPLEYIENENNWVSVIFSKNFLKEIKEATKEDRISYIVGQKSLERKYLGDFFYFFLKYSFSTQQCYKLVTSLGQNFNKVMKMEVLSAQKNHYKFKYSPSNMESLNEEEQTSLIGNLENIYENTLGYLQGIPVIYGNPPATASYEIKQEGEIKVLIVDLTYQDKASLFKRWTPWAIGIVLAFLLVKFLPANWSLAGSQITFYYWILVAFLFAFIFGFQKAFQYRKITLATENAIKTLDAQYKELQVSQEKLEDSYDKLKVLNEMKSEFLANTSHELRTPLNGIIGLAESLMEGATGKLPDLTVRNLNMIAMSGKRLTSLVNDILDFSKLQKKTLEINAKNIDLNETVDQVIELSNSLIGTKEILLESKLSSDLPLVRADENRLFQILYNLIGNAIKFTEQGQVKVEAMADEERMTLYVKDSGIGIPAEKHHKIFESFEQADGSTSRNYGGTGLGLAITKQLIELQQGQIWVESVIGKGSTFAFTLPLSVEQVKADNKTKSPESGKTQNEMAPSEKEHTEKITNCDRFKQYGKSRGRILVVDDEPVNLQVLINHLSLTGYETTTAMNGKEALEVLQSATEEFDLVLLDIMMPVMNGFEFCKAVREKEENTSRNLPIIMLTAKNQIDDLVQAFCLGANDYITKPFIKEELIVRVKNHLSLVQAVDLRVKFNEKLHSEKLTFLGQLIAGVAHEINTPIGTSLTAACFARDNSKNTFDLLENNKLKKSQLHEYFTETINGTQIICTNINRVHGLIDNFKMLSIDHNAEHKKEFNLERYLKLAIELLANEVKDKQTVFKILCDPDINLNSYPGCLVQILSGLISNSLIHGYEDKELIITIQGKLEENRLLITYQDDGCGIPHENRDKIFDPFFTTKKNKGSIGLGLNIIMNLVTNKLAGEMIFENRDPSGVQFHITLPLS